VKYYRVTAILEENEYRFVVRISRLMSCSLSRALAACVAWAMDNERLLGLLDLLERERARLKGAPAAVEGRGDEQRQ
jgi:hypothetical protein